MKPLVILIVYRLTFIIDGPQIWQNFNLAILSLLILIHLQYRLIQIVDLMIHFVIHAISSSNLTNLLLQQIQLYINTMTFFNLEQKEQKNHLTQNSLIGPDRYQPQPRANTTQHPGYAPFGSLAQKSTKKPQQASLGPGQYNISSSFIKPSIKKYENNNIIIVKINYDGGHQFKSRTNRFQQTIDTEVGPGSYELHSSKRRVKSNTVHRQPKIVKKLKEINQHFAQSKKPTLLSDPPVEHYHSASKSETSQAKGVVKWSLNHKERFDLLVKQQSSEEDQREAISKFNEKLKKPKPSAVFASKSIKSHLETQIYKTSNPFKADLRKMIDYKDEQPGPGSYQIEPTHKNKILPKFQFFGSTVERFPSQSSQNVIGPGFYEIQGGIKKIEAKQNLSFSEERHSYLPKKDFIPGPGAYQVQAKILHSPTSDKKYEQPAFGSQQPRFNQESSEQQDQLTSSNQLAINRYFRERQQKRLQDLRILKQVVQDHPSAVFTSNTKRFNHHLSHEIELGQYDTTQNDINGRLAKQQRLIKQLQQCQLHRPAFHSSDQRFKQVKVHQSEHKNCWCQVKNVEKQMLEHQSPVFLSIQKRSTVFESPSKAPPVGYYNTPQGTIIKDSFNSRFRKRNVNRIKKDLAFKIKPIARLKTEPLSMICQGQAEGSA